MENVTFEEFINFVKEYNPDEVERVTKAYEVAQRFHDGQYRDSGEPYITHPLQVAYILAELRADGDTLCAALLHDCLEDTTLIKGDIEILFSKSVADLVDGVTKLSRLNFSSKEDQNFANTRKIITSVREDVRIIIIKLADRLHNMRTLGYKSKFKQKENALETMEIYVPFAYNLGCYQMKRELEDLSFKYLREDDYKRIFDEREKIVSENKDMLDQMAHEISASLSESNISNIIIPRIKNIYGIFSKLENGYKFSEIHDLLALKIIEEKIIDCYTSLFYIHNSYVPIMDKFRDYIASPKTNKYQSIHTTVISPSDTLVQCQIRTRLMDRIDTYGLPAYWDTDKGYARIRMQEELKKDYQFYTSLKEIDSIFKDNEEFVTQVKEELFTDKVYVNYNGDTKELPKGSTGIDLAYKVDEEGAPKLVNLEVNNEKFPINYVLQNRDRVKLITGEEDTVNESWLVEAHTTHAKELIKERLNKESK